MILYFPFTISHVSPRVFRDLPFAKLLFFISFFLLSVIGFSQTWNWAKGEGNIGNDVSNAIAMDESGNAYITGNIAGKADFSGTIYQGSGIYDVFIAKYDPQGNVLWVKLAGGTGNDQGNAIRYKDNFIYVTGYFSNTATFETTTLTSRGDGDAFTAKYDLNGNLIWVRQAGGTSNDFGNGIDIDNAGNVYMGGNYKYAITVGSVQLSTTNIYNESFFAKYNSNGDLAWAKSSVGNNFNLIMGLAFDNHNSVFLTGYFNGSFTIGSDTVKSNTPSYDIFLSKLDGDGNVEWLNRAGSPFEDAAHGVCCDNDGNPSITGYFSGTAFFGNNSVTNHTWGDVFVARYDAAGNNLWVRAGKGLHLESGYGITVDGSGNIFATGMFDSETSFDGDTLRGDANDIFMVSYSANGNKRWLTRAGAAGTDCGLGIAVANSGRVALTGYYLLTCAFGTITLPYADGNDLFIAEFTPPVVNSIAGAGEELQVAVLPNPFSEGSGCKVILQNGDESTIKISDIVGNEILTDVFNSEFNIQSTVLSKGVYFVEIRNRQKAKTLRLVKQ